MYLCMHVYEEYLHTRQCTYTGVKHPFGTHTHAHIHTCIYVCMYVCMHVYEGILRSHTHTHTHTQALSIPLADPIMSCVDAVCIGQFASTLEVIRVCVCVCKYIHM